MGAVGIDHGNGYITQYLHMENASITVSAGQYVSEGSVIGNSSDTGVPGQPHLHFEVLRKVAGSPSDITSYKVVDPYGWAGSRSDPLEFVTGVKNIWLWK
jgi:murein DD-endopeptidase MepM/ murein hydrolase activator NlpD